MKGILTLILSFDNKIFMISMFSFSTAKYNDVKLKKILL